jgi:hypothetical protein
MTITKIECYYLSVLVYPYIGLGTKGVQTQRYFLPISFDTDDLLDKNNLDRMRKLLSKGICAGKFDDSLTTCAITVDKNKYFIDKKGVIKFKNKSYYINPGEFIWLYVFLEGELDKILSNK